MKKTIADRTSAEKLKHTLLRAALYTGILLLLLIPTYVATATYVAQKNAPDEAIDTVYTALSLTGPSGSSAQATQESNYTLFTLFADMLAKGEEVTNVPETHTAGVYTVTMKNDTVNEIYKFYFAPTFSVCYYTDPLGRAYEVSGQSATQFLNSSHAFELYAGAILPTLTTAATDEVLPSGIAWYYRIQNGSFSQLNATDVTQDILTYPIANDIAFYFSIQPSHHEVIIRQEGTEIYRGGAEGISLTLEEHDQLLDVEINATYNQDSRLDYYGSMVYRFRMQVVEAAHFTLNTETARQGGFLVIKCENVKNASKLEFSATPALQGEPIVLDKNDLVYAIIPITNKGTQSLRVTYGTIAATFSVSISSPHSTDHTPDTSGMDWVTLLTQTLPAMIREKGADSAAVSSAYLPSGPFAPPSGNKLYAFGDTLTMSSTALEGTPLPFELYLQSSAVTALSVGTVLEVGWNVHLGNYVILDHGAGLYTWYCGLSEIYVAKGTVADRGEALGAAGSTLLRDSSALIMATLGKSPVSPSFLHEQTWSFIN